MTTRNLARDITGIATESQGILTLLQGKMVVRLKATLKISREVLLMLLRNQVKSSQHLRLFLDKIHSAKMIQRDLQENSKPLMKVINL